VEGIEIGKFVKESGETREFPSWRPQRQQ